MCSISSYGGISVADGGGKPGRRGTTEAAKQECLRLIELQTVGFHALLAEFPELEEDPGGFAGRETDDASCGAGETAGARGGWRNVTLDGFLDAAAEESELKEGRYDRCWGWLREFYLWGQSAI